MNVKNSLMNWRRNSFLLIIIGPLQYIICTSIAMIFYAGGTFTNPNATGYSFWQNFFSDLGRTIALSGNSNTISLIIFMISAIILVFSLILYVFAIPIFFKEKLYHFRISRINLFLGTLTGVFMFGVLFTPWDIFSDIHLTFSKLFSLTSLVVLIYLTYIIIKNENYPNIYAYLYLIVIVIALVYTFIVLIGPELITQEGLILQASAQKISQYSWLICFMIQGYGSLKLDNFSL
ncbi:MAG: hypothetical protein ACFE85_14235 [Candidatus Hodarchaeota archaeon]